MDEYLTGEWQFGWLYPGNQVLTGWRHRNRINVSWMDGRVSSEDRNMLIAGLEGDDKYYYRLNK